MTSTTTLTAPETAGVRRLDPERADLLEALAAHRGFLRSAAEGLTDEQAAATPTVSALCIGGLIKHVAHCEEQWARFAATGDMLSAGEPVDWSSPTPESFAAYQDGFRMLPGETLAGLLAHHAAVAAATDTLVASLDLDACYPLPEAPWFTPGATRSVRRVWLHVIAETAQHAGHADIIREAIDGKRSMG